jgi:hypothetical protein
MGGLPVEGVGHNTSIGLVGWPAKSPLVLGLAELDLPSAHTPVAGSSKQDTASAGAHIAEHDEA